MISGGVKVNLFAPVWLILETTFEDNPLVAVELSPIL